MGITYVLKRNKNDTVNPVEKFYPWLRDKQIHEKEEKEDSNCKIYFMCCQDKNGGVFMVSYVAGAKTLKS